MSHVTLALCCSALFLASCSSNEQIQPSPHWQSNAASDWSSKDLLAGPSAILKSPFSVLTCPFRLIDKETQDIARSNQGAVSAIGQGALMPVRAIVDGVFTGVGYLGGGLIDTVSGGTAGLVSGATGESEPNSSIHCALSGTFE